MKSPLQTAFEKMTDEELKHLSDFASDRSKGAAARLWVMGQSLADEQVRRGITKKRKGINAITHPEEFLAAAVLNIRANQAAQVSLVKGTKTALAKMDDPQFMQAVRAHFGVNDFYGDEVMKAVQELDEQFFKMALEAVRDIKSKNRKAKIEAGGKMILHIEGALQIFRRGDKAGESPHRKVTKKWLMEKLEKLLGEKSFSDEKSWQLFFKRPEIKPFVERERSGGRPETSGKGRAVESFGHHQAKKLQGGK